MNQNRKLISIISTEGKSPEQIKKEAMEAFRNYHKVKQQQQASQTTKK